MTRLSQVQLEKILRRMDDPECVRLDITGAQDGRLDSRGLLAIAKALPNSNIRHLNIELENARDVTDEMRTLLDAIPHSKLESFGLPARNNNEMPPSLLPHLAKLLPQTQLTSLEFDVSGEGYGRTIRDFIGAIEGTTVSSLRLGGDRLDHQEVEAVAEQVKSKQLQHLSLRGHKTGGELLSPLLDAIPGSGLRELHLDSYHISTEDGCALGEALPHSDLHTLNLGSCSIGAVAVEGLAQGLKGSSLEKLYFSHSRGERGLNAIAEALPESTLCVLESTNSERAADAHFAKLAEAIPHSNLIRFRIENPGDLGKNISTCLENAEENWKEKEALAIKVMEEPQALQPAEWDAALDQLSIIHTTQKDKWAEQNPATESDERFEMLLAEKFLHAIPAGKPEVGRSAVLQLLPLNAAKQLLEPQNLSCKPEELLAQDNPPSRGPICRGGVAALLRDDKSWENVAAFRQNYARLSAAGKAAVPRFWQSSERLGAEANKKSIEQMGR